MTCLSMMWSYLSILPFFALSRLIRGDAEIHALANMQASTSTHPAREYASTRHSSLIDSPSKP